MAVLNITNLDIVYFYRNVVCAAFTISEYFILLHRFSSNGLQTLFTQFILHSLIGIQIISRIYFTPFAKIRNCFNLKAFVIYYLL